MSGPIQDLILYGLAMLLIIIVAFIALIPAELIPNAIAKKLAEGSQHEKGAVLKEARKEALKNRDGYFKYE